jgi:hypothetical protein
MKTDRLLARTVCTLIGWFFLVFHSLSLFLILSLSLCFFSLASLLSLTFLLAGFHVLCLLPVRALMKFNVHTFPSFSFSLICSSSDSFSLANLSQSINLLNNQSIDGCTQCAVLKWNVRLPSKQCHQARLSNQQSTQTYLDFASLME